MKRIVALCAGIGLAFSALAADRVCNGSPAASEASVQAYNVELQLLTDGGCAVLVRARLNKPDGGALPPETTPTVEIAGTNRTQCLDIMVRATALFKTTNGF